MEAPDGALSTRWLRLNRRSMPPSFCVSLSLFCIATKRARRAFTWAGVSSGSSAGASCFDNSRWTSASGSRTVCGQLSHRAICGVLALMRGRTPSSGALGTVSCGRQGLHGGGPGCGVLLRVGPEQAAAEELRGVAGTREVIGWDRLNSCGMVTEAELSDGLRALSGLRARLQVS